MELFISQVLFKFNVVSEKTNPNPNPIGVGRFRILWEGARFRIFVGEGG